MTFVTQDPIQRFNAKIVIDEHGCHRWQSVVKRDGYGHFWMNGRQFKAHRAAYLLFRGNIPNGMMVLHKCDVRCCVNPEHLFIGTMKDNVDDMDAKGRRRTRATLNAEQVMTIRRLLAERQTQHRIASLLGITQSVVSRIKRNNITAYQKI